MDGPELGREKTEREGREENKERQGKQKKRVRGPDLLPFPVHLVQPLV